jgi:tRNA (guanine-N7-)-methyltransferase
VIDLYELPVVQDIEDIYATGEVSDVLKIKTHYESLDIAQSNKVHYLQFMLPATSLPDKDDALKLLLLEEDTDRRS